ncbi:hypothetical protein [Parasutterella excrementihominis]|uniref:hypothetical protein n=3 Tax=Parasutterella TaxID=577310 RepID=UPI00351FAD38
MSAAKKNSLEQGISPISQEEFIRDFLPLPILHRGILFVLRTGYLIKQSPLEDLDVLGLCPTHTAEEEGALHVVLRRFFNRDASFWRSAAYDAIIQEELETKAHHKLLSEQRSIKSKRAAEARWKENGAPSNAPSIKNDAPSNAPSINNDATSNAPSINNDATSNAPGIKSDATSNAPGIKSDATSNAPSINNDAPSNAPSINNDATSNAPGIKSDATSNAPSINNDAPSNAPGIKSNAPSNAPSIKNDAPSNAPSIANYAQKTLNPLGHRVFQEKADMIENPGNVQQEEPRARTRAHRSDRISDINLINKNINKSESVSESDRRLKIKNLFAREKSAWMIGEVLEVLVFFGLDEKALARWRSRNPENQNFILELAAGGMSRFDYDTIAQVFARCQAAKDKEGKPLSSAVAFVLKSLQHELTAVSNRKNARQSASESAQPKRFRDIDYMEGIERLNPDGTFVLKRKTEGR